MAPGEQGETLGQYRILERIGAGGLGEVYRARDTRLGRTVAVRVVDARIAGDPQTRAQFIQDARIAANLSHPNIAALYEVGETPDQLFLALEYVPGQTLRQVISGAALNPRTAIDFAIQMADALADAHAAGIVHRDLRPDNVFVTPKGSAKILEFGLSRWTAGGAVRAGTGGSAAGAAQIENLAYMSPEQALGAPGDHRTDIFSLGTLLFEMLTGRRAFGGATADAVTLKIVQAPLSPPSEVNKDVPPELDPIVARATAKSLEGRYESAASMAGELRSVAAILDVRTGDSEPPVAMMAQPRQSRAMTWAIAVILLAVIGALLWYAMGIS